MSNKNKTKINRIVGKKKKIQVNMLSTLGLSSSQQGTVTQIEVEDPQNPTLALINTSNRSRVSSCVYLCYQPFGEKIASAV